MDFRKALALSPLALALVIGTARAAEPASCQKIRMADVGWTDNTAQNGLFNVVVTPFGYKTKIDVLDLPVILEGLKSKKLDLFLDNWLPSNEDGTKPYRDAHTIDELPPDLTDAPYGPVVPNYVAEAGVKDIKDLGPNAEKFGGKFYGIEPGNDGNKIVQKAIDDPKNDMQGFKLVESSEQGMLAQAQRAMAKKQWIVFLGWAPHPVMAKMPITYLSGWNALRLRCFADSSADPRRVCERMPEHRQAAHQPEVHDPDGIRGDGGDQHEQGQGWRPGGDGLVESQSGRARYLACRRNYLRWPGRCGGGKEVAGHHRWMIGACPELNV